MKPIKAKQLHDKKKDFNFDRKYRVNALNNFKRVILAHEQDLYNAIKLDLNKSEKEFFLSELSEVINEIEHHAKKLKKWMKPTKVKSTYETMHSKGRIIYTPVGKVLIIAPFNYPFNLSLIPLVGSISAGNQSLMKLSEYTPNINKVIYKIIDEAFDNDFVTYIQDSELKKYDELYEYEPNLVFFTGSTRVGKIIESECVKRNIKYITELGGMCPCLVNDIKHDVVYKRIVWAKFLNAGQTCVSINHILYNKNIKNFVSKLVDEIQLQFPNVLENQNMAKIINKDGFNRLVKIIEANKQNIVFGGNYDKKTNMIEPTVIKIKPDQIAQYGELFGPILFVAEVNGDIKNNLKLIRDIDNSPLAAYLYSNDKEMINEFTTKLTAGTFAINDSLSQILNHHLPFGGVYTSGTGSYHGHYSFVAMSYTKPILLNKSKKDIKVKYINNEITLKKVKKSINFIKKFKS